MSVDAKPVIRNLDGCRSAKRPSRSPDGNSLSLKADVQISIGFGTFRAVRFGLAKIGYPPFLIELTDTWSLQI